MASPTAASLSNYERAHMVSAVLRGALSASVLLGAYFTIPVAHRPHQSIVLRLTVALALFGAALATEVRLITRHDRPMLRAAVSMATVIPLFLVLFSWIYLTMSLSDPHAFGHPLSRGSALYFTVSVFSTVGFGDIVPKTDVARLVATVQMMSDLVVIAVVVRLILAAASRGVARLQGGD